MPLFLFCQYYLVIVSEIYSIVCLYVNVWSVEYEQFEDFAAVEDFQDPEQFPKLVEDKSLLHSR
jgi:nitrogen fixation-related uncharacterized protein